MKSFLNKTCFTCLSFLFLFFSSTLYALPVSVLSVGADWTNVQPIDDVTVVSYIDSDGIAGNEEIIWGNPASDQGQSGYRFDGAAPDAFTVETGDIFSVGDFSHTNQPVWGSITGAQLNITMDLMIAGAMLGEGPFSFSFLHDETTNACEPLPDCSNDLVSFSNMITSDSFLVDDIEYTLELIGFSVDGIFTTEFSTVEGQVNTAQLLGTFTVANSVPAPPAFLLLLVGLTGILFGRKKRQAI